MKLTLYRTAEEVGSPHRAIGTFTLEELQAMGNRGELSAGYWLEEAGMFGGKHRVDQYGPLMEAVSKPLPAGEPEVARPARDEKPDLLARIRHGTRYRPVRHLIEIAATMLLVLVVLGGLVMLARAMMAEDLIAVISGFVSCAMGGVLVLLGKHSLIVLVDIADTLLHGQERVAAADSAGGRAD